MDDGHEYSNGADGLCQECGEETEEEWHALCQDCYAEAQGWRRPDRSELDHQRETRERVSLLRLLERVNELERRLEQLEGAVVDRAA